MSNNKIPVSEQTDSFLPPPPAQYLSSPLQYILADSVLTGHYRSQCVSSAAADGP